VGALPRARALDQIEAIHYRLQGESAPRKLVLVWWDGRSGPASQEKRTVCSFPYPNDGNAYHRADALAIYFNANDKARAEAWTKAGGKVAE
jgi:hypothetical protein